MVVYRETLLLHFVGKKSEWCSTPTAAPSSAVISPYSDGIDGFCLDYFQAKRQQEQIHFAVVSD